jgi:polygalacturonase
MKLLVSRQTAVVLILITLKITGASAQTSAIDRGSKIFDVRKFGAKGDGITDDSDAIERAARQASASGGVILCPPGVYVFNPALHKIVMGSNTRLTGGCVIRVAPDAGNYQYIISARTPSEAVENITIDDITIDQNTFQNSKGVVNLPVTGTLQIAIMFFNVKNIAVKNSSFVVSGVTAIDCNGRSVSGVHIEGNKFLFQKRPAQPPFDNSTIYVDGSDFSITDNVFQSGPQMAATTAIETHAGTGLVSNNVTSWYASGIIAVNTNQVRIASNIIAKAQSGISLWATHDSVNRGSQVASNIVNLNNRERQSGGPSGIFLWHGNESTGDFDGLTIEGNTITFEPDTSADMHGYDTWGIGLESNGSVSRAIVRDNVIVNAPIRGIKIGAVNGGKYRTITISGNTVVNAGLNTAPKTNGYRAAIALDGNLEDVEVRDNRITCSDTACDSYGIYGLDQQSPFINVQVLHNFTQRDAGRDYSLPVATHLTR